MRHRGAVAGATAWFNPDATLTGDATMGAVAGATAWVNPDATLNGDATMGAVAGATAWVNPDDGWEFSLHWSYGIVVVVFLSSW